MTSLIVPAVFGWAVVAACWPSRQRRVWALLFFLGPGVGLGISSALAYLWLTVYGVWEGFFLFEGCVTLVWVVVAMWRLLRDPRTEERDTAAPPAPSRAWAPVLFIFLFLCAFYFFSLATSSAAHPYGVGWDAWAIWRMKAHFLFEGAPLGVFPSFTHGDYPLLRPLILLRAWTWAGEEASLPGIAASQAYSLGVLGATVAGIGLLVDRWQGLLAGCLLLAAPTFTAYAVDQYVDLTVAFFFLSAVLAIMFTLRSEHPSLGLMSLAGLCAGLAAWSKNEGIPFVLVLVVLTPLLLTVHKRLLGQRMAAFLLGLAPAAAVVFLFRLLHANSGVYGGENLGMRLANPDFHFGILRSVVAELVSFERWHFVFFVALAYAAVFGINGKRLRSMAQILPLAMVLFMGLVYVAAYYLSPHGYYQAGSSLDRLVLQVYPLFLVTVLYAARTCDELGEEGLMPIQKDLDSRRTSSPASQGEPSENLQETSA